MSDRTLWHPESPGIRVTVRRPWWAFWRPREFATLGEVLAMYRRADKTREATK